MCSEAFLAFTKCHVLYNQLLLQSPGLHVHKPCSRNARGRGNLPPLDIYDELNLHACDIRESWAGQRGRASQAARSEVKEEDQRLCSLSSYRCAEGVLNVRFSMLRFTGGVRGRMSCAAACTLSTLA